ncbi:MAG: RNA pseudouridine synthase [Candidatus Omnitrophica bacterium CG07_land_8_20_14_0_80_42_15]|uniref:RNA pseudouridine synthase n=1 Tax=Candidatus Aquitaenariimonas noxiae TaxID=1974741 RepID=A0A2J0KUD0_9BACT|nr:MAG: RNA pseudouridine synthase [Candidatus Omnitrophica bacterium CG07_land_8_20_14_0_80_42_15]
MKKLPKKRWLGGIEIIYEDKDILVVDKPPGLLTMGTGRLAVKTAYYILTDYVRKGYSKSRNRVYIVHRLDRGTSGILIFAKSEKAKLSLQAQWGSTEKKYLAVVHGQFNDKAGTITSYLAENKAYVVYSTKDAKEGKLSHTAYKVIKETKRFSLLEINLITGRKNQIRVHLADRGHPVVGDEKYGKKDNIYKRLALHAKSVSFNHPYSGRRLTFETKFPGYFGYLLK